MKRARRKRMKKWAETMLGGLVAWAQPRIYSAIRNMRDVSAWTEGVAGCRGDERNRRGPDKKHVANAVMTFQPSAADFLRSIEARRGTSTVTEVLPLSGRRTMLGYETRFTLQKCRGTVRERARWETSAMKKPPPLLPPLWSSPATIITTTNSRIDCHADARLYPALDTYILFFSLSPLASVFVHRPPSPSPWK